jgi:hypothetical protein
MLEIEKSVSHKKSIEEIRIILHRLFEKGASDDLAEFLKAETKDIVADHITYEVFESAELDLVLSHLHSVQENHPGIIAYHDALLEDYEFGEAQRIYEEFAYLYSNEGSAEGLLRFLHVHAYPLTNHHFLTPGQMQALVNELSSEL